MTAFLKIDRCQSCQRELPWDWIPPISLAGKTLAGTGVWRSSLVDGLCEACQRTRDDALRSERRAARLRDQFIRIVGGSKAYRQFTFEGYLITSGNRIALEHAKRFHPANDNLYIWGPCGVGKTHLAVATLRRWFSRGASIAMLTPFQLVRRLRMKPPDEEQHLIDEVVRTRVLLLDDFGAGSDSVYARQALQEIFDGRDFKDRGGLIITAQDSLAALAKRLGDRAIPSRLAGMCDVVAITGPDQRMSLRQRARGTTKCPA